MGSRQWQGVIEVGRVKARLVTGRLGRRLDVQATGAVAGVRGD